MHGSRDSGPSDGGAVTFEITGLLANGTWVVKDDYLDPAPGESAPNYYNTWQINEMAAVIDWTCGNGGTDGGVFRAPHDAFSVTINPAFNEQAALFGEQYEGTVESWQFLVPTGDAVQRLSLDMSASVTVETGSCDHKANKSGTAPATLELNCLYLGWFIFEKSINGSIKSAVITSAGGTELRLLGLISNVSRPVWRVSLVQVASPREEMARRALLTDCEPDS